jgi:hypothetical protein
VQHDLEEKHGRFIPATQRTRELLNSMASYRQAQSECEEVAKKLDLLLDMRDEIDLRLVCIFVFVLSLSCLCLVFVLSLSCLCLVFVLSCLVFGFLLHCVCSFLVLLGRPHFACNSTIKRGEASRLKQ